MPATIRRCAQLRLPSKADDVTLRLGRRSVTLTHLEKIFWPEAGRTKRDLFQYYADVAPALLPHLADRAMVMKRGMEPGSCVGGRTRRRRSAGWSSSTEQPSAESRLPHHRRLVRYRTECVGELGERERGLASPQYAVYIQRPLPRRSAGYPVPGRCHVDPTLTTPHGPIWYGATVLVVDDEPALRDVVRRTLEAEGFHVEDAPDGASALHLVQARAEPFDLVLTDLSMPVIDGRQVSETLARYRPGVALLCMSGDPDAVPHIETSDTPVRVLLKPFTPDDLYHAVRDAITRATDLAVVAEAEIVRAHAGLSKLALALEASRTMRVETLDLVVAARELRRAASGASGSNT